jgi:hypothetical protein
LVTWTVDESARCTVNSAGCSASIGSSGLSNATRTVTLSSTRTSAIVAGTVSRSMASSSTLGIDVVTATVDESHFSSRSSVRLWLTSRIARTVYVPAGSGPTSNWPVLSVALRYTTFVSGCEIASTYAPVTARCAVQSNTWPTMPNCGNVGPVENSTVSPVFRTLPRRSARPGSIVIRYAVLGRKPLFGLTEMRLRCQDTFTSPLRGEMRNS